MKKNVLLICEAYGGGVKSYVDKLLNNMDELNEVNLFALISSNRDDSVSEFISNEKFTIDENISFGKKPVKFFKSLKILDRLIKLNNIELIHANSSYAGLLTYFYSIFNKNINYIYTPHGYYSLSSKNIIKQKLIMLIEKRINKRAVCVIHVSDDEDNYAKQMNLISNNSKVINNGVEIPVNIHQKKINKNSIVVGNLSRLESQKNPMEFLEIAEAFSHGCETVSFVWAGTGSLYDEMRNEVATRGIKNISFIGYQESNVFLNSVDIYFSTSLYEGLPFSVVEAMSLGKPLILSDVVGHTNLVEDNGYLYQLSNIEDAISKLKKMCLDERDTINMGMKSYDIAKRNFDYKTMLSETLNTYIEES